MRSFALRTQDDKVTIIGGGLAGSEAAWQLAKRGIRVRLYEMRPAVSTAAHKTGNLAELVCSNSLRAEGEANAAGLLKLEMKRLGSLVMEVAEKARVPAGLALAVDRHLFSAEMTTRLAGHPLIEIVREEVSELPTGELTLMATGPLTSQRLTASFLKLTGGQSLYFFDAISPIIDAESIRMDVVFRASRYERGENGAFGDYLNCPLTERQYYEFVGTLLAAEKVPIKDFERDLYFESCLPIEVMAERGRGTLAFGPMKPVGLEVDGVRPYAVVQLRTENREGTCYNMVGFQTKLTYPEQKRIFRMIPGLEEAEFLRFGSLHRNTFIESPRLLTQQLHLQKNPLIYMAGQITGVEGYIESTSIGLLAALNIFSFMSDKKMIPLPSTTAMGALLGYLTTPRENFQPMNINFGLFPLLGGDCCHSEADRPKNLVKPRKIRGPEKKKAISQRAMTDLTLWLKDHPWLG